ncbi:MAG TPA: murein L,D-transpeptidase [Corynebacterium nuruki]|uniref:Murein L,D-transpeptidase n=1 Tax=Corynebacterium nuruki TaxID=1032851 RepID=A0A3D4SZ21_9CORY|nr:murein L,D-transpeptidase [Corynebacterium nuruki]
MRSLLKYLTAAVGAVLALAFAPTAAAQALPELPQLPQLPPISVPQLPGLPDLPAPPAPPAPGDNVAPAPAPAPDPVPAPDPAPAPAPAPDPAPAPAPCAVQAKACINLTDQTAWLQDGAGNIVRGPVPISSGKPGFETPVGTTQVTRKVIDEWSVPYNAPMPYSVYFSAGTSYPGDIGIAFHEGDPAVLSNGCIHLLHDDAVAFFDWLQPGDVVDVVA